MALPKIATIRFQSPAVPGLRFTNYPLRIYLAAIAIYTNAVKGISALQLGRDLGVQYKTAFVLAHKIRESLMEQRDMAQLTGEVHIDGAYERPHSPKEQKKQIVLIDV